MKNNDKIVDLNKYKEERFEELKRRENIKLFESLITRSIKELDLGELEIYSEIQPVCSFMYKNEYKMIIAEFRGIMFVMNYLGNSTFEYLGTIDEMIETFLLSLI